MKPTSISFALLIALVASPYILDARESGKGKTLELGKQHPSQGRAWLEHEVHHQLVTLPYYSVFDNLAFRVSDDNRVELMGQVSRPTLKSDAERVARAIEGVESVVNDIEVLPTSPNDDRIRVAVHRAIYGHDALQSYGLRSVPPIHIIVKNGSVTLEGVVAKEMDKNIANMQANSISGVFAVTNNLRVQGSQRG
jgi:hyperosmotically inducible periplasmic protein